MLGVHLDDTVAGGAEGVDVLPAHQLGDLHVGTVHGAQGDGAVGHELHVAGAGGLLGGQGDLLGDVAGGDELFGPADVVVLHHHHTQPGAHLGIGLNELAQAEDEVDDVLGHDIGGGGLGAENHGDGTGGQNAVFDVQVLLDDVQGVHLLALVLVEALDLDVKDGLGVHLHVLALLQDLGQLLLVVVLDVQHGAEHLGVPDEGGEVLQLAGVPTPLVADAVVNEGGQTGVAHLQPAAEGDAVGLVVELIAVHVGERLELRSLEDLGVQGGHAVGGVGVVDVHVGHVHHVFVVDNGHAGVGEHGLGPAVHLPDDGHQLGSHPLDVAHGPLLQGLGQDGVVGVGTGVGHLVEGVVHGQSTLQKQAGQLGQHHRGVGVVDLNGHVLAQVPGGDALFIQLLQNQLSAGGHHEVLLIHTQQPSGLVAVVGVEEGGEVVGDVALVKVDAVLGSGSGLLHVKQVQTVGGLGVGAGHGDVPHHGVEGLVAELDGEGDVGGDEPALLLNPGIGLLFLLVIAQVLVEQAVVVVQTHAVAGQAQSGQGVQKASGQTAQTAVAQGGLGLLLLDLGQSKAVFLQQGGHLVKDTQGQQVVAQQLTDEELSREVVQLAAGVRGGALGGQLLGELEKSVVELTLGALGQGLAVTLLDDRIESCLKFHGEIRSFLKGMVLFNLAVF